MTLRTKLCILLPASGMLILAMVLVPILPTRIFILCLIAFKYFYFFTRIKTIERRPRPSMMIDKRPSEWSKESPWYIAGNGLPVGGPADQRAAVFSVASLLNAALDGTWTAGGRPLTAPHRGRGGAGAF